MKLNVFNLVNSLWEKLQLIYIYARIRGWLDGRKNYPSKNTFGSDYEEFLLQNDKEKTATIQFGIDIKREQLSAEQQFIIESIKRYDPIKYKAITEKVSAGDFFLFVTNGNQVINHSARLFPRQNQTLQQAEEILDESNLLVTKAWEVAPFHSLVQKIFYWIWCVFAGIVEAPINYFAFVHTAKEASIVALVIVFIISVSLPVAGHFVGKNISGLITDASKRKIINLIFAILLFGFVIALTVIMANLRTANFSFEEGKDLFANVEYASTMKLLYLVVQSLLLTITTTISFNYYAGYDAEKENQLRKASERYKTASKDYQSIQKFLSKLDKALEFVSAKLKNLDASGDLARVQIHSKTEKLISRYRNSNIKKRSKSKNTGDIPEIWQQVNILDLIKTFQDNQLVTFDKQSIRQLAQAIFSEGESRNGMHIKQIVSDIVTEFENRFSRRR